jgi:hypothetical protein
MARREREILEHAVRTIAEQATKADELVDEAKAAGGGDHPVTVHAKMLRLELLKVKADLERSRTSPSTARSADSTCIGCPVSACRRGTGRTGSPRRTASPALHANLYTRRYLDLGGDVANLPPSETPQVLDGYYEGSTEEGDEVAFIVVGRFLISKSIAIARGRLLSSGTSRRSSTSVSSTQRKVTTIPPCRSRPRTWPSKTMALSCIGPRTPLSCSSTGFCFPADRPEVHASGS